MPKRSVLDEQVLSFGNGSLNNQRGIIQFLLLILLVAGLAIGVYLVQKTQLFRSRASSEAIVVNDVSGSSLPKEGDLPITTSTTVQVQLEAPPAPE